MIVTNNNLFDVTSDILPLPDLFKIRFLSHCGQSTFIIDKAKFY